VAGGGVDSRFEAVRAAFTENFASREEVGASICLMVDGVTVVDLWGGWQDAARTRPWQADTLVNVFSVGKAIAALCVVQLVGQGALQFDQTVSSVWPEFAAEGKSDVTVRQLLSHQGGLPAIREQLPAGAIFDWDFMCSTLAAHRPWWEPGTAHGYHVNTFGFLVGELVRRATGDTLGAMVQRELAGPLAADFYIGVPETELGRIADHLWTLTPPSRTLDELSELSEAQHMELCAYFNPPDFSGADVVNTTHWRTAELPSTNGHANGRGIARIFNALVQADRSSGIVSSAALGDATTEQVYGQDVVLNRPSRFGIGFQLTQAERPLGPNPRSYGHFGAGGSLGFCDPDARLAFGYAINTMGPRWQNPRNAALIEACYDCL
jgi:CubicO group peptidase (beta-lactamase class C family)